MVKINRLAGWVTHLGFDKLDPELDGKLNPEKVKSLRTDLVRRIEAVRGDKTLAASSQMIARESLQQQLAIVAEIEQFIEDHGTEYLPEESVTGRGTVRFSYRTGDEYPDSAWFNLIFFDDVSVGILELRHVKRRSVQQQ